MSTAADLATLLVRRAGQNRKVAVLGTDPQLVAAVEANGCKVLVDPDGPAAMRAFDPDVVVAFDGVAAAAFSVIATMAPRAELLFTCANAGSASALVRQLLGHEAVRGHAETVVRAGLEAAGYEVVARDRVVVPFEPSGLALDAEAALRALLEQVNPEAAADRWLWVCKRGAAPIAPRVPGLLSAVVFDGPGREHTLSALERQSYKPLEIVDSVEAARGQYLALLMPADLPSRDHFARLIAALQRDVSAWALESSEPPALALAHGAVDCCSYVVDRERVGPFSLTLPRGAPAAEAVLFARLAAVFPAALVSGGPSFERAQRPAPIAEAVPALRTRPLRLLLQLEEVLVKPPEPRLRVLLEQRLRRLVE